MKIGVISDTHIPYNAKEISENISKLFSDVDLILHAGDLVDTAIIEDLELIAKVEAVKGNMDNEDNPYPIKIILKIEELKLGLIHGYGPSSGLRDRIRKDFGEEIDIIVYGHSHKPYNKIENGILFFNPGTPTDKLFAPYNSVGILEINRKEARGKIIKL